MVSGDATISDATISPSNVNLMNALYKFAFYSLTDSFIDYNNSAHVGDWLQATTLH